MLGHILGQIKGYAFVGEAVHAWRVVDDRLCGCGTRLQHCDFWSTVRDEAIGPRSRSEEFFSLGRVARWRHLPSSFAPGGPSRMAARYGEHWLRAERLYRSVAAVAGADVIVDSSKSVPYARMLSLLPGLDVRILHLVRDSRAVANAWLRRKPTPDRTEAFMEQRPAALSVWNWTVANLGAELLLRPSLPYRRVRYEDLASRPLDVVQRIVNLVVGPTARETVPPAVDAPFVDSHTVRLAPTHSIKGNPDRLNSGPVAIRLDDRWRREMPPPARRLVTALTWPLLLRYGYLRG
jgi:hypothetical protein